MLRKYGFLFLFLATTSIQAEVQLGSLPWDIQEGLKTYHDMSIEDWHPDFPPEYRDPRKILRLIAALRYTDRYENLRVNWIQNLPDLFSTFDTALDQMSSATEDYQAAIKEIIEFVFDSIKLTTEERSFYPGINIILNIIRANSASRLDGRPRDLAYRIETLSMILEYAGNTFATLLASETLDDAAIAAAEAYSKLFEELADAYTSLTALPNSTEGSVSLLLDRHRQLVDAIRFHPRAKQRFILKLNQSILKMGKTGCQLNLTQVADRQADHSIPLMQGN
jgi:hypothetical protein